LWGVRGEEPRVGTAGPGFAGKTVPIDHSTVKLAIGRPGDPETGW